eukprot:1190861-Prorocentrum_minimum.AAC.3
MSGRGSAPPRGVPPGGQIVAGGCVSSPPCGIPTYPAVPGGSPVRSPESGNGNGAIRFPMSGGPKPLDRGRGVNGSK